MNERLFWVNRSIPGKYESGYLFTEDQLKTEFGKDGHNFDANAFLAGNTMEVSEGTLDNGDTARVKEIGSEDELRHLMTWDQYDPWKGADASERKLEYPDFVDGDLRRDTYVRNFSGRTSDTMLDCVNHNPTYEKYRDQLGLTDRDCRFQPSAQDRAVHDIQLVLADEWYGRKGEVQLNEKAYNEIVKEYGLDDYMLNDGVSKKMEDAFEAGLSGLDGPGGMEQ